MLLVCHCCVCIICLSCFFKFWHYHLYILQNFNEMFFTLVLLVLPTCYYTIATRMLNKIQFDCKEIIIIVSVDIISSKT